MSQTMRKQRIVWVLLGMALGFFGQVGQAVAAGVGNFFVGPNAGNSTFTGDFNTGVGSNSLSSLTTGGGNTAVGRGTLYKNTKGYYNTALGRGSLASNTEGNDNTATGVNSLLSNINGSSNVTMGNYSLQLNTGNSNVAVGYAAGYSNTTGSNNTFLGTNAGNVGSASGLTNATAIGYNTQVTQNDTVILGYNANVGIGTTTPKNKLDVEGGLAVGATYSGTNAAPTNGLLVEGNTGIGTTTPRNKLDVEGGLAVGATYSGTNTAPANGLLVEGNVGIGTSAPAYKLDVVGSGHFSGDVVVEGNIAAKYQDLAEWVPAAFAIPSATVVVLDTQRSNTVLPSTKRYDTGVAGVVTTTPGIVLGEASDQKVKVATFGRVKVKADAQDRAISVGDLLVTSDRAGMAMKSEPLNLGDVSLHRPGTIIGKALEPLSAGQGEILVLLSLQ